MYHDQVLVGNIYNIFAKHPQVQNNLPTKNELVPFKENFSKIKAVNLTSDHRYNSWSYNYWQIVLIQP